MHANPISLACWQQWRLSRYKRHVKPYAPNSIFFLNDTHLQHTLSLILSSFPSRLLSPCVCHCFHRVCFLLLVTSLVFSRSYVVRNMSSSSRKLCSKSLVKGKAALVDTLRHNAAHKPEEVLLPFDPTFGTWTAPFDLSGLPTVLQKRLVVLAPCLIGRHKAVYDTNFFHRVYGLCKDGIMPKEVTKAMVPT